MRLICKISGFDIGSGGYVMNWIRQQPGKGLEWVAYHYTRGDGSHNIYYSPSVKGRFTISKDAPQRLLYLDMTNVKSEDTALYYCVRGWGWDLDYWGLGTMVTVLTETCLSVFPVVPCCPLSDTQVNIGCQVTGLANPNSTVTWVSASGSVTGQVKVYPAVFVDGSYSTYSSLTVSVDDLKNKKYQCKSSNIIKAVTSPVCHEPKVSNVQIYMGEYVANSMEFICLVDDHFPKNVSIIWTMENKPVVTQSNVTHERTEKGLYRTRSTVMINAYKNSITCKATAAMATETTKEISHNHTITSCAAGRAEVSILKLSLQDLLTKNVVTATCVVKAYPLQGVEIVWKVDGKIINYIVRNNSYSENETQTITHTVNISVSDWNDKKPYVCQAKHRCFKSVEEKIMRHEVKAPPSLSVLGPFSDKKQQHPHFLLCMINGDFPNGMYVKWQKNSEDIPASNYTTSELQCEMEYRSCSAQSKLEIQHHDRDPEASYACMVGYDPAEPMRTATITDTVVSVITDPYFVDSSDSSDDDDPNSIWRTTSTFIALFLVTLIYSSFTTVCKIR